MLLRRPILLLALVLLILAAAAAFIATRDLAPYRSQIEAGLERALGIPVDFSHAHLSWKRGPAIDMHQVKIGRGGPQQSSLEAPHLFLSLELLPLFEGRLNFNEISLDEPHLIVTLPPATDEGAGAQPPSTGGRGGAQRIELRRLSLQGGTLELRDLRSPGEEMLVTIDNLQGRLMGFSPEGLTQIALRGELRQEDGPAALDLRLTLPPAEQWPHWTSAKWQASLKIDSLAPAPLLQHYLRRPGSGLLTGRLSVDLQASGQPAEGLDFKALFRGQGLTLKHPAHPHPLPIGQLAARGRWIYAPNGVQLANLHLDLDGATLTGQINAHREESDWRLAGQISVPHLPLDQLRSWLPPTQLTLQGGTLAIETARFEGPLSAFRKLTPPLPFEELRIAVRDASLLHPSAGRLSDLSFAAAMDGDKLQISEGEGLWLGAQVRFDGALEHPLENDARLALKAEGNLPIRPLMERFWPTPAANLEAGGHASASLNLEGPLASPLFDLSLDLGPLALKLGRILQKPLGEPADLFLTGTLQKEALALNHGRLRLPGLEVRANGEVGLAAGNFTLDLQGRSGDLSLAAPTFPLLQRLQARGEATVNYHLEGEQGRLRQQGGEVTLNGVSARVTRVIADLQQATGRIRLDGDGAYFERLSVHLGTSPVTVSGQVSYRPSFLVDLNVKGPSVRADNLIFRSGRDSLRDLDGHLLIDRDGIRFAPVTVRLDGGTRATVTGSVSNFKSPFTELDIAADYGNIDEVIALWQNPSPQAAARKKTTGKKRRGAGLLIRVHAKEGILGPLQFSQARGEITLRDEKLIIHPLDFAAANGNCTAQVVVDFNASPASRLTVSGQATDLEASRVYQEILRRGEFIRGRLNGDFYIEGELGKSFWATSQGGASLTIADGALYRFKSLARVFSLLNVSQLFSLRLPDMAEEGMPFTTLTGSGVIDQGVVRSENLYIDSNAMNLSLVGSFNLVDYRLDTLLGVKPLATVDKIVAKIPLAGWLLTGEDETLVTAHFRIRGPASGPEVTAVPITSLSEKALGIFQRILSIPGRVATEILPEATEAEQPGP